LKYWGGGATNDVYGKDNAVLMWPKNPKVGDIVFRDVTIVETGITVPQLSTGLGPFANCLKGVEPDGDICYYAPNFGQVKKVYSDQSGGWELKEIFYTKSKVVVIPLSD